jgi:CheY-like chemotaxis protein
MFERAPRPLNILLVDDDTLDVESAQRAFRKACIGAPLWVASDGEEALSMLRGVDDPLERRLALLDVNLPKMSGLDVLRKIRADDLLRPVTVVILTTSNDLRDRRKAYDLNVAGYLLKPVTSKEFAESLSVLHAYWQLVELP